jgi:RNA polymerase sigma-70 factor (ECF subfamily)
MRRLGWQGREVPLEPETWELFPSGGTSPEREAEQSALLRAVQEGIEQELSPHQREVLVALALNGVPIDVLAERLDTTRGALYKTLHDARKKLRAHLTGVPVLEEAALVLGLLAVGVPAVPGVAGVLVHRAITFWAAAARP